MTFKKGQRAHYRGCAVTIDSGPESHADRKGVWYLVRYAAFGGVDLAEETALQPAPPRTGDHAYTAGGFATFEADWTIYMIDKSYVVLVQEDAVIVRKRADFDRDWKIR
jgi:hypothetical protein